MKLRGEVEVFKIFSDGTRKRVIKETNMVVDGAAEVIVDMLTTPYSVKKTTGSASLDPSNFMVQALSLGKAENLYGGSVELSAADSNEIGMHTVYNNRAFSDVYIINSGAAEELVGDEWIGAITKQTAGTIGTTLGVSAFISPTELPRAPQPRDTRLEKSSKTQVAFYYENSSVALSSYASMGTDKYDPTSGTLLKDYGHNLNAFYSRGENKTLASLHQGCYAPSDGIDIRLFNGSVTKANIDAQNPDVSPYGPGMILDTTQASAANVSGAYNQRGSMDQNGFLVAYPIQHHPASGDGTYGVIVSAATTSSVANLTYSTNTVTYGLQGSNTFISSPAISYSFSISSSDLISLAAYKGFTNIGLWAFDLKETLKREAAPVNWDAPSNNRKYKLFAKKVFSEDLSHIEDGHLGSPKPYAGITNYANLDIQWRMNFDFGEKFRGEV